MATAAFPALPTASMTNASSKGSLVANGITSHCPRSSS